MKERITKTCDLCHDPNSIAEFPINFTDLVVCIDCYEKAMAEPDYIEELWREKH